MKYVPAPFYAKTLRPILDFFPHQKKKKNYSYCQCKQTGLMQVSVLNVLLLMSRRVLISS